MLDRLQELRDAASDLRPESYPRVNETLDSTEAEQDPALQNALAQDVLSWSACDDLRAEVETFRNVAAQAEKIVLPSKLQQLTSSLKSQEDIVQQRIHRAKGLIDTLRGSDPEAQSHVKRIRENLAFRLAAVFKELVQRYFDTRQRHRDEVLRRARRQLRVAFPEAREQALEDILEFPELAAIAVARRLERGAGGRGASIEEVISELDGARGDLIRLEDGARELKAMFFKFAELVDSQGEALNNVEAQVHEAADHIAEAVVIYKQAERSKEESDWRIWTFRLKVFLFLAIVFCICNYTLVFRSAYWAATGLVKSAADVGAGMSNALHGESALRNVPSHDEFAVPARHSQILNPVDKLPVFLEVQTRQHSRSKRLQGNFLQHDDASRPTALSDYPRSRSEVSAEGILRSLHVSDSIERLISEGTRDTSLSMVQEGAVKTKQISEVPSAHLRMGHA